MTVDRKMFTDRFDKRKAHLLLTNASHTTYFYSCITKNLTLFVVCNWFEFFPIQYVLMLVTVYITNKYELETFRLGISFRVGMRFEIMLVVCQVFNPSCILSWQAKKTEKLSPNPYTDKTCPMNCSVEKSLSFWKRKYSFYCFMLIRHII